MALSRREASLRPERARRSRNHFGTVSVWSKIPPRSMPVSPSPVSRGTSSDLWPSIGSSTLVVFKPQLSPWTHSLCPLKTIDDFIFMFWDKTNFIFQIFQTRPKSRDGRFWRAREAEDSRASHQRCQTSWNSGEGRSIGESWPSARRWCLGMRRRQECTTNDRTDNRAVELQPDFNTIQVFYDQIYQWTFRCSQILWIHTYLRKDWYPGKCTDRRKGVLELAGE